MARDRLHLDAAVLSLAPPRRRLRHRRLLRDQPRLRHGRGLPRLRRGGARARDARDRRPGHEPHLVRPSLVPGLARGPGRALRRLLRLVGHRRALQRRPDHLHRHRGLELDARPRPRPVLLAPLLQPPAGSELREPGSAGRDDQGAALLARPRARRLPARRGALPLRGGGDELREPAAHARVPQARARGDRRELPRPRPPRRGEPVARGRRCILRGRGRVPHGLPLPRDAADVHVAAAGGGAADDRDPRPDAADPGQRAVGALPAQPRRADARDGHGRGARLHVRGVREGSADEAQPRDPAPARARSSTAAGTRSS